MNNTRKYMDLEDEGQGICTCRKYVWDMYIGEADSMWIGCYGYIDEEELALVRSYGYNAIEIYHDGSYHAADYEVWAVKNVGAATNLDDEMSIKIPQASELAQRRRSSRFIYGMNGE